MIKFENVTKKFGPITALEKADFEIKEKEFVFLTGPSGAGKTTIIKLILGDYLPTSGRVIVNDLDLAKIKNRQLIALRRTIGVVFQDYRLITDFTIFENVALALKVLGYKPEGIKKEVNEVLDLVGLSQRANLFPAQLAGGELQRACLARAVVGKPKIVLADEPTGNLDPENAKSIVKLLKKINEMGTTIMMATHNFDIVNSMKERVISLADGQIVANKK